MDGTWAHKGELERPTAPNAEYALKAASYMLWALSGRRWGGIHAVTEEYRCVRGYPGVAGWIVSSEDYRASMGRMHALFGPLWGSAPGQGVLYLRNRPVRSVISMRRIGGEELDTSLYAVYDRAFIAPIAGDCSDPCFDPCCLEVSYTWGTPPPEMGRIAAIELANEIVKAVECPEDCKLPERITSVSRQGVNFQVYDAQDFLSDGRMGIYTVDVFIKAVNPMKAQKRARVFSPDLPAARARTRRGDPPVTIEPIRS